MFTTFKKEYDVEKADILTLLSLTRPNEVTEEHIVTLRGLYQALKSGDTTVADTFGTVVDNTDTDTDKQNSKLFDNDGKVK